MDSEFLFHPSPKPEALTLKQQQHASFRLDTKGDCLTVEIGKTSANGPLGMEQYFNKGAK